MAVPNSLIGRVDSAGLTPDTADFGVAATLAGGPGYGPRGPRSGVAGALAEQTAAVIGCNLPGLPVGSGAAGALSVLSPVHATMATEAVALHAPTGAAPQPQPQGPLTAPAVQAPAGNNTATALVQRPKRLNRLYLAPAGQPAHGPWRTAGVLSGSDRASLDAGGPVGPSAAAGPGPHTAVQRIPPAALHLAATNVTAAAATRNSNSNSGSVRAAYHSAAGLAVRPSHTGGGSGAVGPDPHVVAAAGAPTQLQPVLGRPECDSAGAPTTPVILSSGGLGSIVTSVADGSSPGGGGKSPRGGRSPRAVFGRGASGRHTGLYGEGLGNGPVEGDDGGSDAGCGEADGATHVAKRAASHTSAHSYHLYAADAPPSAAAAARSRATSSGCTSAFLSGAFDGMPAAVSTDAAVAAAAAGRGGSSPASVAAPNTCRLSMKLHSGHVEQIQPGAVAALARLLLPAGWALTNLAVRRGCIELVLEYTRVPAAAAAADSADGELAGGSGGGGAAGGAGEGGAGAASACGGAAEGRPSTPRLDEQALAAAALAAALGVPTELQRAPPQLQEGDLPAHQLEALLACLQQQGLVDPALEPAVTVQVNHQLQCVRWQPASSHGHGHGPCPAATEAAGGRQAVSPFARAAAAGAGPAEEDTGAAAAAAGSWRCQDVPVYCGAPSVALVVEPCCIALPCSTTAAPAATARATGAAALDTIPTTASMWAAAATPTASASTGINGAAGAAGGGAGRGGGGRGAPDGEGEAVLLYVGIPRAGTHCCTVRSQGSFLPATELCRLPSLDLMPVSSGAAGAGVGMGLGVGGCAGGTQVSLPQVLMLAPTPAATAAAAVASQQALPPPPVPTAAATGLLLRRLLGGAAPPAQAARVDLRCAAAVAAAVGSGGQVVVLSLPAAALPRSGGGSSGALLQVECRVPAEECTWSSALEEDLAGSGNSTSTAPQPGATGSASVAAAPDGASVDAPHVSGAGANSNGSLLPRSSDPFSAAAPVLLLRAACCGGASCDCGSSGRVRSAATAAAPWAVAWSPDEVMGATQELLELRRRFAFGTAPNLSSPGSVGGAGGGAGMGAAAAGAATVEFLSDLGLLLDAAAAAAADVRAETAAAAAQSDGGAAYGAGGSPYEYEFPSFAQQLRAVMLEQVGPAAVTAPPSALREHLADTAVTLLAGCGELRLPRITRLVLAAAAALQLLAAGDVEELVAAAADGDAELAARLRSLVHMREAPPLPEVAPPPLSYASPAVSPAVSSSGSSARMRVSAGMLPYSGGAVSATALDPAAAVAALAGLPLPVRPSSRAMLRVDQDAFHSHLHAHLQPLLAAHPQPQPQPLPLSQLRQLQGWDEVLVSTADNAVAADSTPLDDEELLLAAADTPSADDAQPGHGHQQQLPYVPRYTAAFAAEHADHAVQGAATPVTPAAPAGAGLPTHGSDSGVAPDGTAGAAAGAHLETQGAPQAAAAAIAVYQRFGDPFLEASACGAPFSAFRVANFGPQHEHHLRSGRDSASGSAVGGSGGGASGSVEVLSGGAGVMVGGGPRPVPQRVTDSPRAGGAAGEDAAGAGAAGAAGMLMPAPSLVGCSLSAAASLEMGREHSQEQQSKSQQQGPDAEAEHGKEQEPEQEAGAPPCCRLVAALAAACSGRLARSGFSLSGAVPVSATAALPTVKSTGAPEQPGTPIPEIPAPLRQRLPTGELAGGSAAPSCCVSSSSSTARMLAAASGTPTAAVGTAGAAASTAAGGAEAAPAEPPLPVSPAPGTVLALAREMLLGFASAAAERKFWSYTAGLNRHAVAACAALMALTAALAALGVVAGGGLSNVVALMCYGGQAVVMGAAAVTGGAGRDSAARLRAAVVAALLLQAAGGAVLARWVAASGSVEAPALAPALGSGVQWAAEWLAQPACMALCLPLPLVLLLAPWTAPLLTPVMWPHAIGCTAAKLAGALCIQAVLRAQFRAGPCPGATKYHQE